MSDESLDPFKNVRDLVASLEAKYGREERRFSEVSARLHGEMERRPDADGYYREALAHEYHALNRIQEEIAYWRAKLPPFAEAKDGYILLHPVTPENAHLLKPASTTQTRITPY